ncbi:prephenate dehydrogenase [Streptomyces sp. NPDC088801]|uniref:prephenate dehydrogenase n=1 Tax=Streptomyces sp. NPDC088801 TaxID=3365903 RepID=UPI0038055544
MRTALVIGTGLIGTSVALALLDAGVRVYLSDSDPGAARTAFALGAGRLDRPGVPVDLAVIAVPPAQVGAVLARAQADGLARAYTDVASVKCLPREDASRLGCDTALYVGGHPMAGRERSGPFAARADLFRGCSWVLTPDAGTAEETVALAHELVALCGAAPVTMTARAHDEAVALVSHGPHLLSALMAAQLPAAEGAVTGLAGQGLRDMVRIAGGDAGLWSDILSANAPAVAAVLEGLLVDLSVILRALRALDSEGRHDDSLARLNDLLERGRTGHRRVPAKPHTAPVTTVGLEVVVGDEPGTLGQLLAEVGAAGVNVEDLEIEHDAQGTAGTVTLTVDERSAQDLALALGQGGWRCALPGLEATRPEPLGHFARTKRKRTSP